MTINALIVGKSMKEIIENRLAELRDALKQQITNEKNVKMMLTQCRSVITSARGGILELEAVLKTIGIEKPPKSTYPQKPTAQMIADKTLREMELKTSTRKKPIKL